MGFPLEVVGVGKQKITRRRHIKYVDNMDLKTKTDYLDGKLVFKKTVLKRTSDVKVMPFRKKHKR
jgi:hypothetical protein